MKTYTYTETHGDLIALAKQGKFDVIAHGCNCFSTQGAGIALQMAKAFGTDKYPLEDKRHVPISRLGQIDWALLTLKANGYNIKGYNKVHSDGPAWDDQLRVVNAYTQFQPGKNLHRQALILCLQKMDYIFRGMHVGLPQIGCGIAGGDWNEVKGIIQRTMKRTNVTVVIYKP